MIAGRGRLAWSALVALIEHLSGAKIKIYLDRLSRAAEVPTQAELVAACRCGCSRTVSGQRKFVNQDHYCRWLSQERYFGRNQRP
jgi:hypothetical protein